jgi:hypothetical protein
MSATTRAAAAQPPRLKPEAGPRPPHTAVGPAETGVFGLLFLVLAVAVFFTHLHDGSFYYDDWANSAVTHYSGGFGGAIEAFWRITSYRPFLVVYMPIVNTVFGVHQHLLLAWALVLAAAMSAAFFLLLRTLGVQRVHAAILGALLILFPFSDSLRLWITASATYPSIIFYLLGTVVAVRGLRRTPGRNTAVMHTVAMSLYLLSVFTYEITAPAILVSLVFYKQETSWRRAITWWLGDVVCVVLALLFVTSSTFSLFNGGTPQKVLPFSQELDHVRTIADQGLQLLANAAEPFGSPPRLLVIAVLGAIVLVGFVVWSRLPRANPARASLQRWLLIWAASVAGIVVGYVMLVPADPYYSPLQAGLGNRINILAGLGYVTLIYATVVILATIGASSSVLLRISRIAIVGVLVAALGWGYVDRVDRDQAAWDQGSRMQLHVLAVLKGLDPRPSQRSTFYTFDYPGFTAPGVPVFVSSWDLNGAVKISYNDGTLRAYPLFAPTGLVCTRTAIYPLGGGYGPLQGSEYGHTYIVDVGRGTLVPVSSEATCRVQTSALKFGLA